MLKNSMNIIILKHNRIIIMSNNNCFSVTESIFPRRDYPRQIMNKVSLFRSTSI